MPRPKGSKNKKTLLAENADEKIAAVQAEVGKLAAELKAKKAELRLLEKAKAKAEQEAARHRIAEDCDRLLEAVAASGKPVDEVLAMLE